MQISQISPQINPANNFIPSHTAGNEKFLTEKNTLNINYSDQNDSVNLSISRSLTYVESTYTVEDVLNVSNPDNLENTSIFPPRESLTDENVPQTDSNMLEMLETTMEKHYELISKQVEYLLRSISEQHHKTMNQTGTIGDENLQEINNNSSVARSYTVHSQQIFTISQNITIKGNIIDSNYFSPEKTAERIINFALSFYDGGDREKFAEMVKKQ